MSVKISELPVLDTLADNDVLAGVDTSANVTKKVAISTLKNYIDTNTQYTAGTNIDITNNVISAPDVYTQEQTNARIASDIYGKEDKSNKVTSLSSGSTDIQYPSAKVVYDGLTDLETSLEQGTEDLQGQIDSLSTIFNAFPTESDEGTSITLDGTSETKFKKLDLKGNTSQTTYSGKNLLPNNGITETKNGITFTKNKDNTITLNGTATADTYTNVWYSETNNLINDTNQVYTMSIGLSNSNVGLAIFEYINNSWSNKKYVYTETSTYTPSGNQTGQLFRVIVKNGAVLNNVIVKPMIVKGTTVGEYEPYVGGTASPNPSYPQPVNVVSGDNEINVVGKNLLPEDKYDTTRTVNGITYTNNGNGTISVSGTATKDTSIDFIPAGNFNLEANQSYYFYSSQPYNSNTFNLSIITIENGSAKYLIANNTRTTEVIPTSARVVLWIPNGTTINAQNVKLMLVKGTTAPSEYEPYQGNTYTIDLPVENLLPITLTSQTKNNIVVTINADNSINLNGTANAGTNINFNYTSGSYISLVSGEKYTLSIKNNSGIYVRLAKVSDNAVVASFDTPNTFTTFTSNYTGDCYVYITILNGTAINNLTIYPMLEVGSKANSYTPYGTTPIELCKIGTYQDYFYKDSGKWYKYGAIGKVVLNGSETWYRGLTNTTNYYRFFVDFGTNIQSGGASLKADVYSNKFIGMTRDQSYGRNQGIAPTDTNYTYKSLIIYCEATAQMTIDDFKTWLSNNSTTVYYVYATPTNTEITYQPLIDQLNLLEKAMSKDGQTNISQVNNDLPFIVSAEAILSLQNVLDRITLLES